MGFALVLASTMNSGRGRGNDVLGSAYHGLMKRMLEKGSFVETVRRNNRWIEIQESMSTMRGLDWVIGKGAGASWRSRRFAGGEERFMVHNTWLNCFFWGGTWLFIAVVFPLIWASKVFFKSRNVIGLSFASFVIYTYLKFPSYLITMPTHEWILVCVAVGGCAYYEAALRHRDPPANLRPM
jgi:hypothetical protein